MTSKMVAIREDVYNKLTRLKKPGQNLSEVIATLIEGQPKDPLRHFGISKDLEESYFKEFDKAISDSRRNREVPAQPNYLESG